ncbi:MAG: hypothetical protein KDB27_03365 [Planctomycetales bacterium]|nr:hypothetical protein [Planctomycetales bacterium]
MNSYIQGANAASRTFAALVVAVFATFNAAAEETTPCPGVGRVVDADAWFSSEIWAKVATQECVKCHKQGGNAEDSRLVLTEPGLATGEELSRVMTLNHDAFASIAKLASDDRSLLLAKVIGDLDHGGEQVLKPDSTGFHILEEFVRRVNDPSAKRAVATPGDLDERPFFEGVTMLDDRRLLRRATLSLAGRLPTEAELAEVSVAKLSAVQQNLTDGLNAEIEDARRRGFEEVLDNVMREDAFYERLREGFNDIFLTLGVDGNPDSTVLSYEHFEKTRLWYQDYDLSHIDDEKERRQAGYKLANDYRAALLGEPMKLIEYIVRNDRPFTEIVTADYIMVSPYTARGYGIFDELKEQFTNPDDPFEYVPVRLKALVGRNRSEDQDSKTGFYPHAGILSMFQYLSRYPTTETNRNRLRARMYYQHFLGVDVLELAARVSDAAAVTAKFEIPTMQASECVVCHKTLDPVAGLFQDYWRFDRNFAIYGKRKEGWFTDMFGAGFEGEALPFEQRWRSLQWLGERTAKDPRFAVAMTEHAYYILTGRRPLLTPKDLDDPLYRARQRAYQEQRCEVERIARRFVDGELNFRHLIADWILSDFYRADGLMTAADSPERLAELDDIGVVRMLSPEQLERKIAAVFGRPWGRLTEQTAMLYGGIDSKEVTERAAAPSGAMGAIQRTLSNDVACRNVAYDFSRKRADRVLFPNIEPDVLPGSSAEADGKIREAIVHLHERVLGRYDTCDSLEVDRTFGLFAAVIADAAAADNVDSREAWSCRQGLESPVPDPNYTVRAWRAVVTYLLRQEEFLYE